jgi:uncharacterized Zn-binding protein involved in type VI secretion
LLSIIDHIGAKLSLIKNWIKEYTCSSRRLPPRPKQSSHPAVKPIIFVFGGAKMAEKSYRPKWPHRGSGLLVAFLVIGLVAILPRLSNSGPKDDATGTVSKAEPTGRPDGTPAHPYADASQCPSSTDLIIWRSGRASLSFPPGISVCFVGNQSLNESGPNVQIRAR